MAETIPDPAGYTADHDLADLRIAEPDATQRQRPRPFTGRAGRHVGDQDPGEQHQAACDGADRKALTKQGDGASHADQRFEVKQQAKPGAADGQDGPVPQQHPGGRRAKGQKPQLGPGRAGQVGKAGQRDYAPVATDLAARVRALTAAGLAHVLADSDDSRLRACQRSGCTHVFVDTSRNGRRRFCSIRCANQVNVAEHRSRNRASHRPPR
ncbi:MAG TPA: CGNR zinc finger domain-containing protein [Trebonia sp.]